MHGNFLIKLLHEAFMPSDANDHRPYVLRKRMFLVYGVFVMFTVVMSTPIRDTQFKNFLATITEGLVIARVNPDREDLGLLPLSSHAKLTQAAQLKAEDMIGRGYFSHEGPNGEKPWVWLERVGYKYATAGENLAMDFSDPTVLVNAWLASPTHARNIRKGYFTDVGVGVAHGYLSGRNTTVVVMFLGREITPTLDAVLAAASAPVVSSVGTNDEEEPLSSESIPQAQEPKEAQPEEPAVIAEEDGGLTDIAGSVVSPATDDLSGVPPETPVIVSSVGKKILDEEIKAILAANQGIAVKGRVSQSVGAQSFAVSRAPSIIRIILTILFSILAVEMLIIVFLRQRRYLFFASRIAVLSMFIVFLWLPGIFV